MPLWAFCVSVTKLVECTDLPLLFDGWLYFLNRMTSLRVLLLFIHKALFYTILSDVSSDEEEFFSLV